MAQADTTPVSKHIKKFQVAVSATANNEAGVRKFQGAAGFPQVVKEAISEQKNETDMGANHGNIQKIIPGTARAQRPRGRNELRESQGRAKKMTSTE